MEELIFGWIDYGIFAILLGFSLLIGVYFSYVDRNGNATEYLFAGKKMTVFPVSISILSSAMGAVIFLGVPTETYLHGTVNAATYFAMIVNFVVHIYVSLPVFWDLKLDHCYEYLELRFSKSAKTMASVFFIFSSFLYAPITIYASALAFSQVTGFEINSVTVTLSVICTLYTSFGGVRAVIWTEILQFLFVLLGLFSILTVGLMRVGGPLEAWRISEEGGRIKFFEMNPSLYERDTFWAMFIGTVWSILAKSAFSQMIYQRCRTVENRADLNRGLLWAMIGCFFIITGCIFTGLVLYVYYRECDPIKAGLVERSDQILPLYVMDVAADIPGLPGLFLAGIVSSGLSTLSATLNTLTGIIFKDMVDPWISEETKNSFKEASFMKVICLFIGGLVILMTFLIQELGTLYEISRSLTSAPEAALLCLFLLGVFCPWVGKTAVTCGTLVCLVFMVFLVGGGEWHIFNGNLDSMELPTSIQNCSWLTTNVTKIVKTEKIEDEEEPFFLFKISVMYYCTLGTVVGMLVGMFIGFICRENKAEKPEYYAPMLRRFLAKTDVEHDVPEANLGTVNKIYLRSISENERIFESSHS